MKHVIALAMIIGASILSMDAALARGATCSDSGYCPKGTCAQNGGNSACHVSNCSAANCSRGLPKPKR
jgi:hypothetical protein